MSDPTFTTFANSAWWWLYSERKKNTIFSYASSSTLYNVKFTPVSHSVSGWIVVLVCIHIKVYDLVNSEPFKYILFPTNNATNECRSSVFLLSKLFTGLCGPVDPECRILGFQQERRSIIPWQPRCSLKSLFIQFNIWEASYKAEQWTRNLWSRGKTYKHIYLLVCVCVRVCISLCIVKICLQSTAITWKLCWLIFQPIFKKREAPCWELLLQVSLYVQLYLFGCFYISF